MPNLPLTKSFVFNSCMFKQRVCNFEGDKKFLMPTVYFKLVYSMSCVGMRAVLKHDIQCDLKFSSSLAEQYQNLC